MGHFDIKLNHLQTPLFQIVKIPGVMDVKVYWIVMPRSRGEMFSF